MKRVRAWLRTIVINHWKEGVVLVVIVCLDRMGWLPQLVTTSTLQAAPSGAVKGVCLLVGLTLAWALADELAARRDGSAGTGGESQDVHHTGRSNGPTPEAKP